MLTETWLEEDTTITILLFQCCSQYKRSGQRSGGVAIYKSCQNNENEPTYQLNTLRLQTTLSCGNYTVGDMCCSEFQLKSGLKVHCIAIYISPGQTVQNIITYLHYVLFPYTEAGARQLGNNLHLMPIIMGGDFNTNFANPQSQALSKFLFDVFHLHMSNSPQTPTTNNSTTIDAVFHRFLNTVESKIYISYFSYHKPILTICT